MHPIATDVAWGMVCLCVCVYLLGTWVSRRDAVWGGWLTHTGPRNHVLDGGRDLSTGRGNFGGCPAHWKALGVSTVVYAAKGISPLSIMACGERDNSFRNSSMTCNVAFRKNSLTTCTVVFFSSSSDYIIYQRNVWSVIDTGKWSQPVLLNSQQFIFLNSTVMVKSVIKQYLWVTLVII